MQSYTDIPSLAHFVLEESYVLEVSLLATTLDIRMDVVLARDHPDLMARRAGEWAYVREGVMRFTGVSNFEWSQKSSPALDPEGTPSWDGFESFERDEDRYRLVGGVDVITFRAVAVEFEFTGDP